MFFQALKCTINMFEIGKLTFFLNKNKFGCCIRLQVSRLSGISFKIAHL